MLPRGAPVSMASPSAGMTKEEIKQRLAQMKKQYAQMQKKLEKSDKATRVKRHVSKKIADYKQKQATGGSPDCTVSKPAESLRDNPQKTGSPSVPSDNRGQLSTETRVPMTREKNGKRRSVSFALSSQSTPTSSRHDLVHETPVQQEHLGDSLVDQTSSSRVSPQHQAKKMEGVLKESRDVPSKKLFKSAKSERQKPVLASSGDIVVDKSTDSNVGLRLSDHHDSKQGVSTGKDENIIKASMTHHRADDEAQSESHLRENRMHKMDTLQMEEILSSPDAKTPPEDTQFDLFADSEPREESPEVTETVSEFPTDHSRVSDVKRVTAASSLQVVSSCGQHLMSSGHAGKDSFQDLSQCELKGQKQEVEESLIILDETQIDLFHTQIPERCTQGKTRRMPTTTGAKETIPVVKVANPINTSKNHPEAVEKCPTGMMPKPDKAGEKALHYKVNKEQEVCHSHQDPIYSVSDEEGTEDPDVIPSTFPDDLEPVTKNNSSQNSNSGHSDVSKAKHNQERVHANIEDIINKDFQSVSNEKAIDETGDDRDEIIICTQRSEANQVDVAQISARVPAKGEPVDYDVSKVTLGNDETQQNTKQSQDPDFTNLHSQEALICSPENTSSRVHESPEEKGKNGTHRRRRKNQRSIDNLSVDDISLKDFVVSQQNSQEGSHTWIDGLMYPAEYYVRKTRSMSKPSPNQYSAPLLGQKRSAGSSRGRKGPLPRNCQTTALSEPVVCTNSLDEGQLKDGRDASDVEASEKIDLSKDNTCALIESAQDSMGRRHYETTKSAPKEPYSPRKMKVLRKPAVAKRRRGRKSSKKKLQGDSEQSVIKTTNSQTLSQALSQNELKEPQNYLTKSQGVSKHEGDQIEYSDRTNNFSNKDGHPSVAGDPHFEMNSLDLQEKPARDENESNTNSVMWEGNKHISITQMTNNPLESQFTQTQVPSNFALPQVFGTPGHVTQVTVGLSPHSPTSTAISPLGSPTIKLTASQHHGRTDPVPNLEHRRNSGQNQKYTEDQWMSEVYLADVVGELPDDDDSEHQNQDNLQEVDGGHLSPHSQDLEINDHPNILSPSQCVPITESKASDIPVMNVTRLVDDLAQETTNNSRPEDILPGTSSYSIASLGADIKRNEQHTSERTATTDLLDHNEPIQDHISSSTPAISSSLCSNVDQGSPMADAATGTPPKIAEMPQAQSQCTDSYRDGPELDERSHGKEIADGDLSVRECFQFRGCLEHKTEPFSEVQRILSSRLVTKGGSESLIAVVFPLEIIFWVTRTVGSENDFQALCSWRYKEGSEKISLVELQPGLTDAVEAVVAMGDEEKFHSVRCIRWDCKKTRWEENTVLSSKHIPQTTHTSLCVLQERKAALAVYRKGAGSEVLVVGLASYGSENQDFPVVSLPASKNRINSLKMVKGAVHMLLGVTDSEALLWQVPSQQLVQQFNLKDQRVNICIEATAESGLLFMVAFNKLDNETKDHSLEPSCSLLVVNPMNGHSSKLLSYSSPCMQPGNQIKDASVFNKNTLAACLTSGHICVWDLHSSQLLMEACHEPEKGSTAALCQQDAKTLLLASDSCINIYERSF